MMAAKHAAQGKRAQREGECAKKANGQGVYLQRMRLGAFGRFVDKPIGPFKSGLNVVYGANEAGKTTARAFVGGVLFGWPEARGSRNSYKPKAGDREGTLVFFDEETAEVGALSRARNADGLIGDEGLVEKVFGDLDKETFQTLFSLDADELRSLADAPDISAKLFTAGSATKVSPAQVSASIDARIASYSSRAASETESFPNLARELDSVKARIADARCAANELKDEDVELRRLIARRDAAAGELAALNSQIERLAACKGEFSQGEAEIARFEGALSQARSSLREAEAHHASVLDSYDNMPSVSFEDERAFRALIEPLARREAEVHRRVEAARDAYEQARSLWQVQTDSAKHAGEPGSERASRAIPIACLIVGIALCLAAFASVFAASAHPLVCAAMLICAAASFAFGALLARQPRQTAASSTADSARAAMVACKSTLDSREGDAMVVADEAKRALTEMGFFTQAQTAQSALADLDAAAQARFAIAQSQESLNLARIRFDEAEAELSARSDRRAELLSAAQLPCDSTLEDIEAASVELVSRRCEIDADLTDMNSRIGQLKQLLSDGERETEFDLLKTARAQIATRQRESAEDLARLLLARRLVLGATESWGSELQPEVYVRASRLMELMTSGAWTGVRLEDSQIYAVDPFGQRVDPRLLSLGTCQQLYLALRIALLECVPAIGFGVPVLCDDILVNFDDERRGGAVLALEQLSRTRQVIVFTCHEEVVSAFVERAKRVHVLRL